MKQLTSRLVYLCALFTLPSSAPGPTLVSGEPASTGAGTAQIYTHRTPSPGGTGKVYLGREISQVMGHRGAAWLDRPGRAASEQPDQLVKNLPLRPGDVFADIGAGTGYFTFRVSPRIPEGKVLAVDIQPEMLAIIEERVQRAGVGNVVLVLGSPNDPNIPDATVDMALMVDAYHEFSHPWEMMTHFSGRMSWTI